MKATLNKDFLKGLERGWRRVRAKLPPMPLEGLDGDA